MQVDVVGAVAQIAPAIVLLSAALAKVLDLKGFRRTLARLGVPELAAPVVVGVEFLTAVALLVAPAAWWPRALVVLLGTGFAAAGLVVVLAGKRVDCRCFGSAGRGVLGWRQVAWLPVWLVAAGVAQWWTPDWGVDTGFALLAFAVLGLLAMRVPDGLRTVRTMHEDRIAVAPVYVGVRQGDPDALTLGEETPR